MALSLKREYAANPSVPLVAESAGLSLLTMMLESTEIFPPPVRCTVPIA